MRKRVLPAGGQVLAITLVVLFAAAVCPDRAQAAFPGENGRFVLTWSTNRSGVGTEFVLTANKQGRRLDVIARCSYGCSHTAGDWSPSGRRLVYVETSGFEECLDCAHKLVKVAPNGSHRKVVYRASPFAVLSSPAWSPDGRRIAFVEYRSNRPGKSDIYVIRRDGTHLVRLTNTRRSPKPASTGRVVTVWSSTAAPGGAETINSNSSRCGRTGKALRRLTDNDVPDAPAGLGARRQKIDVRTPR